MAAKLIEKLGTDTIRLKGEGSIEVFTSKIKELPYVQTVHTAKERSIHIGIDSGQKRAAELLNIANECKFKVDEIKIDHPDLGDVFFSVTGNEIRD